MGICLQESRVNASLRKMLHLFSHVLVMTNATWYNELLTTILLLSGFLIAFSLAKPVIIVCIHYPYFDFSGASRHADRRKNRWFSHHRSMSSCGFQIASLKF